MKTFNKIHYRQFEISTASEDIADITGLRRHEFWPTQLQGPDSSYFKTLSS
ncbi:MAG: hypothetical protein ACF8CQ_05575 [Rhodopirellula sp. JB044]|uniref:hypothetical protein n=1 Tax=Rhodopirellula sp. JB044 TaxID=3342844 RepID=UPI00370CB174